MNIKRLSYKPGTMVIDKETGELLVISYTTENKVFFRTPDGKDAHWDYLGFLGRFYIKSKLARLLYGR